MWLDDCRHRAPLTIHTAVRAAVIAAGVVVFLWIVMILLAIVLVKRLF